MQQESLTSALEEIRLAEFEREARAYRARTERAYLNGWYDEALGDFLEAEKRNYPDYTVHRSIAQIYLYHIVDLPKALEYFLKAAKYARPSDQKQAAEANYFAGVVCVIERQLEPALEHLRQATSLNPELTEAHYEQSRVASLLSRGMPPSIVSAQAIKGDARYYERARSDAAFDSIRPQVQILLDQLMRPVREKIVRSQTGCGAAGWLSDRQVRRGGDRKSVSSSQEPGRRIADLPDRIAVARHAFADSAGTARTLRDRYYKQYEIDPRDYVRSVAFWPWEAATYSSG